MLSESGKEAVILLHGIGHSRLNMAGIARVSRREGFAVQNISYPSLRMNISGLACYLGEKLEGSSFWASADKVHFIAHSMGGLVAQKYLTSLPEEYRPKIGRLVMLGTPNGGSEVADYMTCFPPYRWIYGPAGMELTTEARAMALPTPYYDTGVIAGTSNRMFFIANRLVDWKSPVHDGRVTVESTKTPSMKDHIAIPVSHSLMAWSRAVQDQTIYFLRNGAFKHE